MGSSLASYFVLFSLISLVSFYFVFISFRFVSFLLISFRFVSFRFVSFSLIWFRFVSFRFYFVSHFIGTQEFIPWILIKVTLPITYFVFPSISDELLHICSIGG